MAGYYERPERKMKMRLIDERCKPEQNGDWIDLRMHCHECNSGIHPIIKYKKGDIFKVSLGFAAELPKGYHAQVVARSSTRKHFGVMLTNAIGIIDESYMGDNDIWKAEFISVEDGEMKRGDRIVQFRLVRNGDPIEIEFVEHLGNPDRGGYGSTGK